jgi:hypothetical protein
MDGGRTRDFVVLRTALAIAGAALLVLIAAPAALAGSPATDQYGSAIPGGGNSGNTSGSSPSGDSGTTIPVAGDSSSSGQQAIGGSGGTEASSTDTGSKGGSSDGAHKGSSDGQGSAGALDTTQGTQNTSHSVPQIAADSAGDSWVPFFIAALVALACAAGALVYRNRRRTAQG